MSAKDLDDMTFDTFQMWSVKALKEYLARKGLKQYGPKIELVARAFSVWESGAPDVESAEAIRGLLSKQYQDTLVIDGVKLPDPLELKTKWEKEASAMCKWPHTMLSDISEYLSLKEHDVFSTELRQRLLKDYKDQKSFSFFSSKWLFEILYHEIDKKSDYCFLKANCTPSQRISCPPYTSWVAIVKESGKIMTAYCTCFAGLGQSCNHIAAILLKVDYCWRMGYVSKACTSKECTWNVPSGAASVVQPQRIKDLRWQKPTAMAPRPKKQVNPQSKKRFCPTKTTNHKGMTRQAFMDELKRAAPKAVCLVEKSTERLAQFQKPVAVALPHNPVELCQDGKSVDEVIQAINQLDIKDIEGNTRGQATNQLWLSQRHGRLTASNFHDIFTKMKKSESNPNIDCDKLTGRICGYSPLNPNIRPIKYGRNMEQEAVDKYKDLHRQKCGKQVQVRECGLFILETNKFIGASPDGVVSCDQCEAGLLEVKCPLTAADSIPSTDNVKYLVNSGEGINLNKRHKYYTQIQGQLGVTGELWCDFFVYSRHGYHMERIYFENKFWQNCENQLIKFYNLFVMPELLHKQILLGNAEKERAIEQISYLFHDHGYSMTPQDDHQIYDGDTEEIVIQSEELSPKPKTTPKPKITPKPKTTPKPKIKSAYRRKARAQNKLKKPTKPLYMCINCSNQCKDIGEFEDEWQNSIECTLCELWCHWACTGLDKESLLNLDKPDEEWLCAKCVQL